MAQSPAKPSQRWECKRTSFPLHRLPPNATGARRRQTRATQLARLILVRDSRRGVYSFRHPIGIRCFDEGQGRLCMVQCALVRRVQPLEERRCNVAEQVGFLRSEHAEAFGFALHQQPTCEPSTSSTRAAFQLQKPQDRSSARCTTNP